MRVKITTLAENSVGKIGTIAEHGLSMLLELDDLCVLLDAGPSSSTVHNARFMDIDLSRVSHIVLSHGHWDHTGGLRDLLAQTGEVTVHAHTDVWKPRYSVRKGQKPRYTGLPYQRGLLEALGATFDLSDAPIRINENVMTTGPVPRKTDFEKLDSAARVKTPQGWEQDQILDDQSLLVKTPKGLVVLLGCAHSGIVNHLNQARKVSGEERIFAVLGGTHLGFLDREQLTKTVAALKEMD
ncbi:MAG: MBL fold metallo-hydrolase, partial [Chloroflexota bacterium]